jgi:hypothetical protein
MRRALFCIFMFPLQILFAASPALTLSNQQLPSPAPVGAHSPHFSTSHDGRIELSWIESEAPASSKIAGVRFDAGSQKWLPLDSRGHPQTFLPNSNGEVTVRAAGRQAKAWFDAKRQAVLYSFSPDAGAHFLLPQQIEDSHPVGKPDVVLLSDGTGYAVWPERPAGAEETALWLRRISPGGSLSIPVLLGTSSELDPAAHIAVVQEGENAAAKLLLVYENGSGDTSQLIVRFLSIDPTESTSRRSPCNCPDDDAAAAGYPIRGRIVTLLPEKETVVLAHDGIPEVLPAGTTEFAVGKDFFSQAKVGTEVLGRAERLNKTWQLLTPHLLVRPQK